MAEEIIKNSDPQFGETENPWIKAQNDFIKPVRNSQSKNYVISQSLQNLLCTKIILAAHVGIDRHGIHMIMLSEFQKENIPSLPICNKLRTFIVS